MEYNEPEEEDSGEAHEAVVVVSTSNTERLGRGTMGGVGLRLRARRELLQQTGPQYRTASSARKRELLDAFTQITGYHCKYAIGC
jgi:hypothetical protein